LAWIHQDRHVDREPVGVDAEVLDGDDEIIAPVHQPTDGQYGGQDALRGPVPD